MGAADRPCSCRGQSRGVHHYGCHRASNSPQELAESLAAVSEPLEPFADRHEQAAAEDAMRATLPAGHPAALTTGRCLSCWHVSAEHPKGGLCHCKHEPGDYCTCTAYRTAAPPGGDATSGRAQISEAGTSPGGEVVGGAIPATDRDTAREQIARSIKRPLWAEVGTPSAYALADSVMVEVVDPLLATIARVQALAEQWRKKGVDPRIWIALRRALDGGGT